MSEATIAKQEKATDYVKPQLTVFGAFSKLTAAGSLGVPEAGSQSAQKARP